MICIPPFRGEFGLKIRYHVPAVAALPRPIIVCIEPGEEALYPDAQHIVVERNADEHRRDLYGKDAAFVAEWSARLAEQFPAATILTPDRSARWPEKRFIPQPLERSGISSDVVICPRKRRYGVAKNWPHWPYLALQLQSHALTVFGAGAPDSSSDMQSALALRDQAWEYPRPLDASIEAMLSARLVIATDAGLAHLAVLCGRPLLLIGYRDGRVAPGPMSGEDGRTLRKEWWPIRLDRYYHQANHTGSLIRLLPDGWENPMQVVAAAVSVIGANVRTA